MAGCRVEPLAYRPCLLLLAAPRAKVPELIDALVLSKPIASLELRS